MLIMLNIYFIASQLQQLLHESALVLPCLVIQFSRAGTGRQIALVLQLNPPEMLNPLRRMLFSLPEPISLTDYVSENRMVFPIV